MLSVWGRRLFERARNLAVIRRAERSAAEGSASTSGTPLFETRGTTKALTTPADADLIELILRRLAGRFEDHLRVFEWGSGLSTLHYPHWLADQGVRVLWIAVEHDRGWFRKALEPELRARGATIVASEGLEGARPRLRADATGVVVVTFDKGPDPRDPTPEWYVDPTLELDDYVALPSALGLRYHAALVDGRKRRRCLLEAAGMLERDGVALLHDAERPYYQSAFSAFRSGRRIGDELWIGTQTDTDFSDLVPAQALSSPGFAHDPA